MKRKVSQFIVKSYLTFFLGVFFISSLESNIIQLEEDKVEYNEKQTLFITIFKRSFIIWLS